MVAIVGIGGPKAFYGSVRVCEVVWGTGVVFFHGAVEGRGGGVAVDIEVRARIARPHGGRGIRRGYIGKMV